MKNGIPLKERKHFFITYKESFLGSDMVDWILVNLYIYIYIIIIREIYLLELVKKQSNIVKNY